MDYYQCWLLSPLGYLIVVRFSSDVKFKKIMRAYEGINSVVKLQDDAPSRTIGNFEEVLSIPGGYIKGLSCVALIISGLVLAGCQSISKPRLRAGSYFGSITGMTFLDPNNLGKHQYQNGWLEKNGIVYTCYGGFIDIGHLREAADRTSYITGITFEKLMNNETEFTFQAVEPSVYFVTIKYPEKWKSFPQRDKIAKDISLGIGQYFAYITNNWHEIITWFGYKCTGIFSEYISSFSWEDIYSDLIGTHLAVRALKDTEHGFDDALTILINEELQKLGVQPAHIARLATEEIEGKWYTGGLYFFVTMEKRNFDTGLDDGFVTPWLVPNICPNCTPRSCPVPTLDFLAEYGFSIELEIEPRVLEEDKILKIIYPNEKGKRIQPSTHFRTIMDYIRKEATEKNGPEVQIPNL